jgi:hypothetical protein
MGRVVKADADQLLWTRQEWQERYVPGRDQLASRQPIGGAPLCILASF